MTTSSLDPQLAGAVRSSWHRFIDELGALRPDLYRYCRHLTHSAWDAEDLVQDTLTRAFVSLGQAPAPPPNPRAWLFRVSSNLWIDQLRRRRHQQPGAVETAPATRDPRATREAAGTLLTQLAPQERAAVVLKDVFDLSLDEIAGVLSTSPNAVKAALHRGRGKLEEPLADPPRTPAPGALDAFVQAFNAADLEALAALLLDHAAVEVVGATTLYGPDAAKATVLPGMLFGSRRMALGEGMDARFVQSVQPRSPRAQPLAHRGQWLLALWYAHTDGEFVRGLVRLDVADGRVLGLRNYFFTPELIAEVCAELGLPARSNGHRWCTPGDASLTPLDATSRPPR